MAGETKSDLEARVAALEEQNKRLTEQLDEARESGGAVVANSRPRTLRPSFGISEGERTELENTGVTTSPFTGAQLTRADAPDGVEVGDRSQTPDDVRRERASVDPLQGDTSGLRGADRRSVDAPTQEASERDADKRAAADPLASEDAQRQ